MPNPIRAESGWPPVVVAGAYQTGVVLMRDLVRHGVEVCCIDTSSAQVGFRTVYGKAHLCPNPDDQPEAWVEFMAGLARRAPPTLEQYGRRPVLIASADLFVAAIARHARALEEHFIFPRESMALQELLASKRRQYELAETHGLSVSRTQFVGSREELLAFARAARFPCLLKPLHFREWERFPPGHPLLNLKVTVARSVEELEAQYRLAEEQTPHLMVQEVIEGPDTAKLVYLSCYGEGGRRLGSCVLRELRTHPIHFGSASVVEPVADPETDALCDGFLSGVGYRGLCEIELKRDTRDGRVKMIEANPRYSVTADAAPYLGVPLGWLHYLDLIGESVEPVALPPPSDFRHIVLQRDFATFRSYLNQGVLTWKDLLGAYRPPVAFFDFDLQDWRLSAETSLELVKTLLLPAYRRFFPKTKA